MALADKIARITDGLDQFGTFLTEALAARIRAAAQKNAPHLDRWVECLSALNESFERSTGLHLEPRQTLISAGRALAATARRAGSV
jgi:hypothetical protein